MGEAKTRITSESRTAAAAPALGGGWTTHRARRAAFLVDAADYFEAFAAAAARARQSILILAWELDSRVRLHRDGAQRGLPDRLAHMLDALTRRRPGLEVHVLAWDHSLIYSLEREGLLGLKMERGTGDRVHFAFDSCHPPGGSHHQKLVVVDDRVAFLGGIDLAAHRWDTPVHSTRDPRRVDPSDEGYPPFHDVQMIVEGEVAAALGDLARERWRRATGEALAAPDAESEPWPPGVAAVLTEVDLALIRTMPAWDGGEGIRETEQALLETIAAARRSLYIESQYLTAARIGEALAGRLEERGGPEVVVVTPRRAQGWLEEATLGSLRARLLRRLRRADREHRLRVVYPVLEDGSEVYVHSKLMVADDRHLYLGSANLANRSMGLDSELGVLLSAEGGGEAAEAIAGLRTRLLAEHLGSTREAVAGILAETGSMREVLDRLGGSGRHLGRVGGSLSDWADSLLPSARLVDPRGPAELSDAVEEYAGTGREAARRGRAVLQAVLPLLAALALAAAWSFTPLGRTLDPTLAVLGGFQQQPFAGPLVVAAFIVGGVLAVPLTALVLAAMVALGGVWGGVWSMAGALASAAVTFGLGRALGRNALRRIAGGRVERLSRRLARRGVLAVAILRNLPIAPYTFINLAAGASPVTFWRFIGGTCLGLLPGLVVLAVFGETIVGLAREPSVTSVVSAVAVVVVFAAVSWIVSRRSEEAGSDA